MLPWQTIVAGNNSIVQSTAGPDVNGHAEVYWLTAHNNVTRWDSAEQGPPNLHTHFVLNTGDQGRSNAGTNGGRI